MDEVGVSTNLSGAISAEPTHWADFYATTLSGANLSQANLKNANFLAIGTNAFTDWPTRTSAGPTCEERFISPGSRHKLTDADVRGANFDSPAAKLTDANVTGADLLVFRIHGGTALDSTASYQAHDLSESDFDGKLPGRREPQPAKPHQCPFAYAR